jgi:hypothetical protein
MANTKISALTAATTPLAGTEVLPIVQSGATVKVANNDLRPKQIQSNATSGVMQIAGPAAAATRVMTIPDANFTAARTDASQTFNNIQTFLATASSNNDARWTAVVSDDTAVAANNGGGILFRGKYTGTTLVDAASIQAYKENATDGAFGYGLRLITRANGGNLTTGLEQRPNGDIASRVGNVIFSTAAKGVNFTANTPAAGMTSQLLNWYEEGSYTVTLFDAASGGNASATTVTGRYTRVGSLVTCSFSGLNGISTAGMTAGNTLYISLPFAASSTGIGTGSFACENIAFGGTRTNVIPVVLNSNARASFRAYGSGTSSASLIVSNITSGSANIDYFTLTYRA